jgi:DNA repair protein RecO (recombination protein O)
VVVAAFYWKLLAAEGVSPQVKKCVGCEQEVELVAFDISQGGAQCRSCRTGVSISQPALQLLQQVLGGQLNIALAQEASAASGELTHLATQAMEHFIERRLRSTSLFDRR